MKRIVLLGILCWVLGGMECGCSALNGYVDADSDENGSGDRDYLVLFWNLENFFDTKFEPGTEDGSFTPVGDKRWGWKRFVNKRNSIAKVLIDIGSKEYSMPSFPHLVGFCEIENRYVVNQLIYETPLAYAGYRIVHRDSPDRRGIDVALLYRKESYRPLENRFINISPFIIYGANRSSISGRVQEGTDSNRNEYRTREILYSKGVLDNLDTLHVFVNHWPSKFGGEKASAPFREAAARALRSVCDSITEKNVNANILIMGDFNDTPRSVVIQGFAKESVIEGPYQKKREGTIKYQGVWEQIDMFFVSKNLTDSNEPISTNERLFKIFKANYLLERDRTYTGLKPKRTFIGPRYNGGISDHLPILLRIKRNW